jgi:hypothetical protein
MKERIMVKSRTFVKPVENRSASVARSWPNAETNQMLAIIGRNLKIRESWRIEPDFSGSKKESAVRAPIVAVAPRRWPIAKIM